MKSFDITDGNAHDVLLELVETTPRMANKQLANSGN